MTEPIFEPPQGGADGAVRAGRRRRGIRTGSEVIGAAAVSLSLLLAWTVRPHAAPAPDRLQIVDAPTASATPYAESSSSRGPAARGPLPSPSIGAGGPFASASSSATPSPEYTGMPQPDPSYPTPHRLVQAPVRSTVSFGSGTDCSTDAQVLSTSAAWCVRYSGDAVVHRGSTARVAIDLCKLPNTGTGSLTFSDGDGMELDLDSSSTTLWSSQDGRKVPPSPLSITVAAGQCERWTTHWDTRDRTGFLVPPMTVSVGYAFSLTNGASNSGTTSGGLTVED